MTASSASSAPTTSPLFLGIGFLAHGGWGLGASRDHGPTHVRTWYPPFCVVVDIVIGGRVRPRARGRTAYLRATRETLTTPYLSHASSACSVRNSYAFSRTSSTRRPTPSIAST